MRLLPVVACVSVLAIACAPRAPAPLPPPRPAPVPAEVPEARVEPAACERIERIEVHKSERLLYAFCERGAQMRLPVSLGREPEGPKIRAGDARTPEGDYRISGPARSSRFHRFIPIDYPSRHDAERARDLGVLSSRGYAEILRALESGDRPPSSALGGSLGFHGEGERWRGSTPHLDWTYGCVALSDDHIDFLAERIAIGTRVRIVP